MNNHTLKQCDFNVNVTTFERAILLDAAPAMLEALQKILWAASREDARSSDTLNSINIWATAALAKATKGAP